MANKAKEINLDEHSMKIAIEALKIYRQQEKSQVQKKKLYNIGLLMNHYLDFIDHYDKIKHRASDIDVVLEDMEFDIAEDDICIQAIKKSKTRTLIMITQIQTALDMVRKEYELKNEAEKYMVVKLLYMDLSKKETKFNERINIVAEEVNCSESTVRRWNTEVLNKMAVKLFGVDGLKLDI